MYALRSRAIPIGGGYDEHWTSAGLKISYRDRQSVNARFDGSHWHFDGEHSENALRYLRSAAVFADAYEAASSVDIISDLLPDTSGLLPQELLRILLDEAGLDMERAVELLLRCFRGSCALDADIDWLFEYQPRTAFLSHVLEDVLKTAHYAVHDAYDSRFRCPVGAIETDCKLELSLTASPMARSAVAEIFGDGFYAELEMSRDGERFLCSYTPTKPLAMYYRFRLSFDDGERWLCADENGHSSRLLADRGDGFRLTVYLRGFETPDWFKRGVMYQVFPDRFGFSDDDTARRGIEYHRALGQTPQLHESLSEPVRWTARPFEKSYTPDDFYGGTLRGLIGKLPYLQGLGVTVIYLNPIFESASNHRYNTSDYSRIDPILGTNEDFADLCAQADALGMRIVLDGVFSHTGDDSVYFNRFGHYDSLGAYQSRQSPYFNWYEFRSFPDDYRCWWNYPSLPEVWELDPSWQEFIIRGENSIVKRWLRRGASGWRLDVADEIPDEALDEIRKAAKAEKPDCLIIGEVWEDPTIKESFGVHRRYALGTSLDSVMNYPLRNAVIGFARGQLSAFKLRDFLLMQQHCYPKPMYLALMNLLGTHDVERLHTALSVSCELRTMQREAQLAAIADADHSNSTALQKLCTVIQYALPGVPCLYYGDEECLDGGGDPFNRAPFEPSGTGLHNFYAQLGALRSTCEALKLGEADFIVPCPGVIIIERRTENELLQAIANMSGRDFAICFDGEPLLDGEHLKHLPHMQAEIYRLT